MKAVLKFLVFVFSISFSFSYTSIFKGPAVDFPGWPHIVFVIIFLQIHPMFLHPD